MGHTNKQRHRLGIQPPELKSTPSGRRLLSIPLVDHLDDLEIIIEVDQEE